MLTIMKILEERKDTIRFVGGIIVGLIVGLIFAWGIWPVKWKDATPGQLHLAYQSAYVDAVAEDYSIHHDIGRANLRLGLDQKANPWSKDLATMEPAFKKALDSASSAGSGERAYAVTQLAGALGVTIPGPEVIEEPTGKSPWLILLYLVLALAAVAVAFYLVTRMRARQQFRETGGKAEGTAGAYGLLAPEETLEGEAPLRSFVAGYTLGDDFFNPSFSIEKGSDFLGECGVDISECLGAGKPKQVTALEVWLFDKSDIRTLTKVVASEYAYSDATLKSKLEAKGEVLLAKPGMEIVLETTALRVRATLKELEFATGDDMLRDSVVQKMSLEIRAWQKADAGEVSAPPA